MEDKIIDIQQPYYDNLSQDYSWKSQNIDKLAYALSKAQSEMKGAVSKSKNPFFGSSYADLHTVIESSLPSLTKYGLSVIQGNRYEVNGETRSFYVTTTLLHGSGQWVKSEIKMPIGGKKDAHAVGSACTYGRRYGLSAMTGIAQHDDDGNASTASQEIAPHRKQVNTKGQPYKVGKNVAKSKKEGE
tara:strand:- start:1686 stop:2246 length:561 start_codon:yes stop_codon:yes gene_type:complete